jgi:hypothetical protein
MKEILLEIGETGISFDMFPRATIAYGNTSTTYYLTITNLAENSNTVDISILDINSSWVDLDTPSMNLDPLETKEVSFQLNIPMGSIPGIRDFRVIAESER